MQDVGKSLLYGISNVITAASSGAELEEGDKIDDEEPGEQQAEKEKKNTEKGKVLLFVNELTSSQVGAQLVVVHVSSIKDNVIRCRR